MERRGGAVEVVLADEHDGQPPDGREVHPLVEGTLVARPVAEEADGDLVAAPQREGEAEARDDGVAAADDRDRGQHPDRGVAEVHRAALAGAAAGALAVELGHRGPGGHTLCECVAVRPVRGGDPVGRPERVADADGDCLLALVLVERPGNLAFEEEVVDRLLEASDEEHLPVQPGECSRVGAHLRMTLRRRDVMAACDARTQGARAGALPERPGTEQRACTARPGDTRLRSERGS